MTAPTEDAEAFVRWLADECLFLDPRLLPGGRFACIYPLLFTHAVVVGRVGDRVGFDDRWCYGTEDAARAALAAWDGTGEPAGWHRHPRSGRRRPGGDPALERVEP